MNLGVWASDKGDDDSSLCIELVKLGLRVELDLLRDPDIRAKEGQIGEIRLGRMIVPNLEGFPWPQVFQVVQSLARQAKEPGVSDHDKSTPIQMDRDLPTRSVSLPEPGAYDIGVWSLAGEPIRGGIAGRINDARTFRVRKAADELREAGFKGSASHFILAHAAKELLLLEGNRLMLGEADDRLVERGVEYTPSYTFHREVNSARAMTPLVWGLRFMRVDYDYYGDHQVLGFRPVVK